MNIRKFIGGTSRDALRLVREALGADAVVLSNRTLDDGSVEIVALADSDLAAIAPADAAAAAGQPLASATKLGRPAAFPGTSTPGAAAAAGGANPYAGGVPDVFSSVFGASPEVGAQPGAALPWADASDDSDDDGDDAAVSIAFEGMQKPAVYGTPAQTGPAGMPGQTQHAAAPMSGAHANVAANAAAAGATAAAAQSAASPIPPLAAGAARTAQRPLAPREAAAMLEQAAAQSILPDPPPIAPRGQRTMAETNPWLIDHARRIANQQEAARAAGISPADAIAKGLGMPADPILPPDVDASTPEWAREAAEVAARRAAARLGHGPEAVGPAPSAASANDAGAAGPAANAAQTVSEAIRTRIEQVVNETVMHELASMRGMMEEQFAGLLWGERQRRSPVQGALTKQLFAAGFSAQLVKMMIDRMPAVETDEAGMEWIQSVLESNLPVLENEEALMERGGVFALMGPTGVGKTTTTAKLAARCVMRFGASRVALLTTDSYRIGGHEQLRIFGKILGVSVHAVRDGADLQLALTELKNKHIVLIDTIGMSQRDRAVADQIAMLCGAGRPVQRLLLLSATSHGDTLNEVVQAYQSSPDKAPLTGCILTKLDEATNLGSALDTVLRYKLPVHYVSTGQKVPENLYVATRRFLVRSAFCVPREHSPFVPHEDDIPALLSALSLRTGSQSPEVQFG
ncbi:flagellar biosynthesis protein FlhF [Paraburkholderia sp. J12]|uniref:flagellar biosynthesis protein FlhF n=1 Tax=Paraburkholderia sp. J12 TaxID=2805432 RepID=UPI002ABDA09D|nr:flagellar biosynthesis protein FlhF [Paraburkholderia sp. J12]